MNILVTGANGQLGNEMRIISKNSNDNYIFTDVNQVEGVETARAEKDAFLFCRVVTKVHDKM